MKRFTLLFLIFLLSSCEGYSSLVDCKDNQEIGGMCIDLTPPEFSGVEDIEIVQGSNFSPMLDVRAVDDLNGDVTNSIVVTGNVNTDEQGLYLLTYFVNDDSGNEKIALRYVKVVYDFENNTRENLVTNGSFDDGLSGYGIYVDETGGNGLFTVVDSELVVQVLDVSNGFFYQPRLDYQGMDFENGQQYYVTFKIKSDLDRKFRVQIGELIPDDPWFLDYNESGNKVYLSTDEYTEYSFTFTMQNATTNNGCILFEFGYVGNDNFETILYLDDISIKQTD